MLNFLEEKPEVYKLRIKSKGDSIIESPLLVSEGLSDVR